MLYLNPNQTKREKDRNKTTVQQQMVYIHILGDILMRMSEKMLKRWQTNR